MALFKFNSETLFVASSDGTTLQIYELTADPTIHPSFIRDTHWKKVATIHPDLEGAEGEVSSLHDGLLFVDDHGRIEGRHALTVLAQTLAQLGFIVSPEGYCFHDVTEHQMFVEMEIFYLRLNDRFSWSNYMVEPVRTSSSSMWSTRFELKHQHHHHYVPQPRRTRYVTILRDEYAKLKKKVNDQDKEIEDMKDEIVEINWQLQKTRREKDREMLVLTYEHKVEVEKLKEEKEDAIVAKDTLLKKKDREIKKKDEEIEELKEDKDDAIAATVKLQKEKDKAIKEKDEEVERLKEEKDDAIAANVKLQNDKDEAIKEKGEEVERLKEEKDDAIAANVKLQNDKDEAIKEKDEEVEKLKEEKDDAIASKAKLQHEKDEVIKKKDEEVESLKEEKDDAIAAKDKLQKEKAEVIKEKDREVERLKEEKDEAIASKVKLQKEKDEAIKKKDEEVESLKEEKDYAIAAKDKLQKEKDEVIKEKDGEVERLKEDITKKENKRKDDESEFKKKLAKKDDEIEMLKKEKNDEKAKTKKMEAELEEARKNPSLIVARAKKELEECRKKSWEIIPGYTKFLPWNSKSKEIIEKRRQMIPPSKFICRGQLDFPIVVNSQKLVDKMTVGHECSIKVVDEDINSMLEWPLPPTFTVYVGRDIVKDFDKNNWWYLKTTHPEGGLTMLAYYEGKHSQMSCSGHSLDPIVPLPFSKDAEVVSFISRFSLFYFFPFGIRLGFAYRPKET